MTEIREYEEKYVDQISKLIIRNLKEINSKDYDKKQIDEMIESFKPKQLKETFKNREKVYMAIDNEEVLGTAGTDVSWYNKDENYILGVFVKPENHGNGIGRALINKVEQYIKQKKTNKVLVHASITAKDFYLKLGYSYKDGNTELTDINTYLLEKNLQKEIGDR